MNIRNLTNQSVLIDNEVYTIQSIFSYQTRMSFVKLSKKVKTWNEEKKEYVETEEFLHYPENTLKSRLENKSALILTPEEVKKRVGENS